MILQLHHPVPPPAARPLPEGKEDNTFHDLTIIHHPVPSPASHPAKTILQFLHDSYTFLALFLNASLVQILQ